jgi:hypothetical protein
MLEQKGNIGPGDRGLVEKHEKQDAARSNGDLAAALGLG